MNSANVYPLLNMDLPEQNLTIKPPLNTEELQCFALHMFVYFLSHRQKSLRAKVPLFPRSDLVTDLELGEGGGAGDDDGGLEGVVGPDGPLLEVLVELDRLLEGVLAVAANHQDGAAQLSEVGLDGKE